jgi:Zn finger protein HypA/HybF involved in hydrogenase expression
MKYTYTEEQLREIVSSSYSIAECLKKLNIKIAGGNYSTLKERFKDWDIDTSHFRGKGWNKGLKHKPVHLIPLDEILTKDSKYQSYKLKARLIKEGYKKHQCEKCLQTEWLSKPIPIELHHIDGDKYNNELSNLKILCPNCHALTDNYRGKNMLSAQKETFEVESPKFRETFISNNDGNPEPSYSNIEGAET